MVEPFNPIVGYLLLAVTILSLVLMVRHWFAMRRIKAKYKVKEIRIDLSADEYGNCRTCGSNCGQCGFSGGVR